MKATLPKSKRLRFSIYVFHIFVFMGMYAMKLNYSLNELAVYMTATAIPLITYVLGDTLRKSDNTNEQ
jgi:hypothetical protein